MDLFGNTAAILYSSVSNSYYGMLEGQIIFILREPSVYKPHGFFVGFLATFICFCLTVLLYRNFYFVVKEIMERVKNEERIITKKNAYIPQFFHFSASTAKAKITRTKICLKAMVVLVSEKHGGTNCYK